jgi:hypothetical protein
MDAWKSTAPTCPGGEVHLHFSSTLERGECNIKSARREGRKNIKQLHFVYNRKSS